MVTFGDTWRKVRLHVPDAPFGLVKEWTQHAYETLCERRPWGWTRVHAQMVVPAARNIVATFSAFSTTVTSGAAAFLPTDVGLQIRVGNIPVYTIQTYVSASQVTIDMPYTGTAGALTAQILGMYQTMPADFGAFLLVIDPYNQRLIPFWSTQEELARIDPTRFSSDSSPRVLVSRQLSTVPSTLGQVQYEWWPAPLSAKAFPYYYRARPQILADTDPLLGVLGTRSTILQKGALAECCAWPGTADRKNPYYNLALHAKLLDEFEAECARLELRDDDQNQDSWATLPYHRWGTWDLTFDTRYLRSTDATTADYVAF